MFSFSSAAGPQGYVTCSREHGPSLDLLRRIKLLASEDPLSSMGDKQLLSHIDLEQLLDMVDYQTMAIEAAAANESNQHGEQGAAQNLLMAGDGSSTTAAGATTPQAISMPSEAFAVDESQLHHHSEQPAEPMVREAEENLREGE